MATTNRDRIYKRTQPSLTAGIGNRVANASAINTALTANKNTDNAVYIPSGTWYYQGVLTLDGVMMFGEADSILIGYDGTTSPECAVKLTGYASKLYWLQCQNEGASVRSGQPNATGILVEAARGAEVRGVPTSASASAGVFFYGATWSRAVGCRVTSSLADAFHHTGGSTHCENDHCITTGAGDDFFAVVSYNGEPICSNILITNFDGRDQGASGRGATVVGGNNIKFRNGYLKNLHQRGIYIASEVSYDSNAVNGVTLESIEVDTTGLAGGSPDPGWAGVWVGGRASYTVQSVTTSNIVVKNAATLSVNAGNSSGIDFSGISAG